MGLSPKEVGAPATVPGCRVVCVLAMIPILHIFINVCSTMSMLHVRCFVVLLHGTVLSLIHECVFFCEQVWPDVFDMFLGRHDLTTTDRHPVSRMLAKWPELCTCTPAGTVL